MRKILIWIRLCVFGSKTLKGCYYREISGPGPIVGSHHYKGFEIVNNETDGVVLRVLEKDYGIISDVRGFDPDEYSINSQYYPENIPSKLV